MDWSAADHCHEIRIYWEDTDASGIVYHANYLKFAERARTEWLRRLGGNQGAMLNSDGVAFVVRRATIDFLRPARLDDVLMVETRLVSVSGASLTLDQAIFLKHPRSGDVDMKNAKAGRFSAEMVDDRPRLVTVGVQLACVDRRGRPVRLPPSLRPALTGKRPARGQRGEGPLDTALT